MTNRIILTPFSKVSQKDLKTSIFNSENNSTFFWDDSYCNTAEVGDSFAVTYNRTGARNLVLARGVVTRIFCESSEEGQKLIKGWDGHQKGRQLLEINQIPNANIFLDDICTKPTKVWGTQRRTLIS